MGIKVIKNSETDLKLFSTNTDSVIAEFASEEEVRVFLALETVYKGKVEAIKVYMTFPNGWTVNDERVAINHNSEVNESFYEWFKKINEESVSYEEYYQKIDEKLEELLR